MVELFDAKGNRVHAKQVSALGTVRPLDLSGDLKEGLSMLIVRVEGRIPKRVRVVVKR